MLSREAKWRARGANLAAMGADYYVITWVPLRAAGRTGLGDLESDGPGGFEVSRSWDPYMGGIRQVVNLRMTQFRETATMQRARFVNLDWGICFLVPDGYWAWYVHSGLSALYLDHDEPGRDMCGFGLYARAGLAFGINQRLGFDVHADTHGWLGGDRDGAQAAGSTSIGVAITYAF